MTCTVPWPFRKWFESRFKDICEEHDTLYVLRIWHTKIYADFLIAARFAERGYVTLACLAFIYNITLGTLYWLWKRYSVGHWMKSKIQKLFSDL